MEEKRFLGFDLGGRRVGAAVSDPFATIARPLDTLIVEGVEDAIHKIVALIEEYDPVAVVFGLPLNLSGEASDNSREVEAFVTKLAAAKNVVIYLEDERLSSKQAEKILHAHGKKIKGNKAILDRISAAVILQSFLDRMGQGIAPEPFINPFAR